MSVYNEKTAEDEILKFLEKYVKGKMCPTAGNCLWLDKAFLRKYMPHIFKYISKEEIDVSSINELAK
jgi:oligoribonuclease